MLKTGSSDNIISPACLPVSQLGMVISGKRQDLTGGERLADVFARCARVSCAWYKCYAGSCGDAIYRLHAALSRPPLTFLLSNLLITAGGVESCSFPLSDSVAEEMPLKGKDVTHSVQPPGEQRGH